MAEYFVEVLDYADTTISFYKVVGYTPSGKSVRLKRCGNKQITEAVNNGECTWWLEVPGEEWDTEILTRRLHPGITTLRGDTTRPYVKTSDWAKAYLYTEEECMKGFRHRLSYAF